MNKRSNSRIWGSLQTNIKLIPSLITIGLIPLIIRLTLITTPSANHVWQKELLLDIPDLFVYSKGIALILMAILSLIIIFINYKYTLPLLITTKHFYILYSYLVILLLSFIFSVNKHLSLTGYTEHYENVFILTSYIILFFITNLYFENEKHIQLLINIFSLTSIILFFIGLGQFLGYDFNYSALGKFLIIPKSLSHMNYKPDTEIIRNVYQTLYHYNYVSFFSAIGLPFFLALAITEKKLLWRFTYLTISLMYGISQIISLSRNGYIGIIAAIIVIIIIFAPTIFSKYKFLIPFIIIVSIALTLFVVKSDSLTAKRLRDGYSSLTVQQEDLLDDIVVNKNELHFIHKSFNIKVRYIQKGDKTSIEILDEQENEFEITTNGNVFQIKDIPPNILQFEIGTDAISPLLLATINNTQWLFRYENSRFYFVSPDNSLVSFEEIPTYGFDGYENFASERGYIWSRSLPLLAEYWLLGSGPDTYPLVFPQNDYIGKFNNYNTPYIVVDKPHSIYLNYGIHTGLISLLLLLAFWIMYIFNSLKLYAFKPINNFYSRVGVASFAAVTGYLVSGLFNDTSLNVTPVFWIILGLGYAVNSKSKELHK